MDTISKYILFLCIASLPGCISQSSADEDYHPGIGTPRLSLSTSQSSLFGDVYIGGTGEGTITITNLGAASATNISSASLPLPYAYKGGVFPGTGGTCESSLNAGLSCSVVLTFDPTSANSTGTFEVTYYKDDASSARRVAYTLTETGLAGAAGSVDTQTYGTNGFSHTQISSGLESVALAAVIQSDGKTVMAGRTTNSTNSSFFAVARYDTNGSLDTSFDTDGKVATAVGFGADQGTAIALQSDGKIVVVGKSNLGMISDFGIARYNTDGSLDTTFDTDGVKRLAVGSADDIAYAVKIQNDGKIVAAGQTYNGSNIDFGLVRLNTDGSLDTTFDGDGKVFTDVSGTTDVIYEIALQSDGKIVAAGTTYNGSFYKIALARYNTDGSLDSAFDGDGILTTSIGSGDDYALAVGVQSDGKIVAAGQTYNGSNIDFVLVRYNTDGSLDTTFDGDGIVTTAIGSGDDRGYAMVILSDGKILVSGDASNGTDNDFAVARYNSDGSLDTTFNSTGKTTKAILSSHDTAYALAVQSDGKIIAAGATASSPYVNIPHFAITRFWP